jgi:hypothetical protein
MALINGTDGMLVLAIADLHRLLITAACIRASKWYSPATVSTS